MIDWRPDGFDSGRWSDKLGGLDPDARDNVVVAPLLPQSVDLFIDKGKPSAFHGTLLHADLVALKADTLIVCGTATSGCVRATVVDAFSHNYRVSVVGECTFDRIQASHWLSLFDMDQKYADVVGTQTVIDYLQTLSKDLYLEEMPILRHGTASPDEYPR